MGTITNIEEKLASVIEWPFISRKRFDPVSLEISLKRVAERKKKNILGKIVIPNAFCIAIDENTYMEYEPFIEELVERLKKSLKVWMVEKGYETLNGLVLEFIHMPIINKTFDISVSYKKDDKNAVLPDRRKKEVPLIPTSPRRELKGYEVVGELINQKTGEEYPIYKRCVVIGRGQYCDIRLNDSTVSDRHACISHLYSKTVLEDLGSKNGIRVNHEKIKKIIVRNGDRIQIGEIQMVFQSNIK